MDEDVCTSLLVAILSLPFPAVCILGLGFSVQALSDNWVIATVPSNISTSINTTSVPITPLNTSITWSNSIATPPSKASDAAVGSMWVNRSMSLWKACEVEGRMEYLEHTDTPDEWSYVRCVPIEQLSGDSCWYGRAFHAQFRLARALLIVGVILSPLPIMCFSLQFKWKWLQKCPPTRRPWLLSFVVSLLHLLLIMGGFLIAYASFDGIECNEIYTRRWEDGLRWGVIAVGLSTHGLVFLALEVGVRLLAKCCTLLVCPQRKRDSATAGSSRIPEESVSTGPLPGASSSSATAYEHELTLLRLVDVNSAAAAGEGGCAVEEEKP